MDIYFYGANCIAISVKGTRIVIDDNLAELGATSILKATDIALFTDHKHAKVASKLLFDGPGEYEVADISIVGIPARSHMDENESDFGTTMYKIIIGDTNILVTGHIHPNLKDSLLERIGVIDVLAIPVGGSGYTLDPLGAMKVIKEIEPKLIIPTHYASSKLSYPVPQIELEAALRELSMEPKERTSKLRIKPGEMNDVMQVVIVEQT